MKNIMLELLAGQQSIQFLDFLQLYFFLLFYKTIFHHINPVVLSTIIEKAFGLSLARFIRRVKFCLGLRANSIKVFLWH